MKKYLSTILIKDFRVNWFNIEDNDMPNTLKVFIPFVVATILLLFISFSWFLVFLMASFITACVQADDYLSSKRK